MAVMKVNFLSRCLGRQLDINVVIPSWTLKRGGTEKYEDIYRMNQKFKTLYLLHGFSGDCNDYISFTSIVRYAEDNNLIVVMPSGFNSGYADFEDGEKVQSFVTKELVDFVRYAFPSSDRREDTYIGGLSMGAAGAAKIALASPEVFSEVYCMSGAPSNLKGGNSSVSLDWFGKDEDVYHRGKRVDAEKLLNTKEDAYYTAKRNVEEKRELPRFKFTIGDKDFLLKTVGNFVEYLTELGYDAEYECIPGFGHEWDFWDLKIREAIYSWFTK